MSDYPLQYPWQELCRDALAEMDAKARDQKIKEARTTVLARLAEISLDSEDSRECDAIEYALRLLKDLALKQSA